MMSRHFALNSELTGAIAKRLPHSKNQPSAPGSFFNQFVTDIYILYTNINQVLIVRMNSSFVRISTSCFVLEAPIEVDFFFCVELHSSKP